MFKQSALIACLAVSSSAIAGEPQFNPFSDDVNFAAEYQRNLCNATLADYDQLHDKFNRLNTVDSVLAENSAAYRLAWAEDLIVTTALRDDFGKEYSENCAR